MERVQFPATPQFEGYQKEHVEAVVLRRSQDVRCEEFQSVRIPEQKSIEVAGRESVFKLVGSKDPMFGITPVKFVFPALRIEMIDGVEKRAEGSVPVSLELLVTSRIRRYLGVFSWKDIESKLAAEA